MSQYIRSGIAGQRRRAIRATGFAWYSLLLTNSLALETTRVRAGTIGLVARSSALKALLMA
ncbi:MAG TPA: hypothetical protein VF040_09045 [Ktedonobacterales bacterium]